MKSNLPCRAARAYVVQLACDVPLALVGLLAAAMAVLAPMPAHAVSVADQEYARALVASPDRARGEQLFQACAACHGAAGGGSTDGPVPVIAAQHFRVLVRQLIDYRHARRWDPRMESVARGHLAPDATAIAAVAAYVSALPRAPVLGLGDGTRIAYGQQVYERLCAACHGAEGQGNASAGIPRIAGQHYAYLLRQLHDAVEHRRPNFSADHVRLLQRFESDDFVGVADYVARLGLR